MNKKLLTKSIGTCGLLLVITGVFFAFYPSAHAQFIATNNNTIADGVVTADSPSSITVATSGTSPLTFTVGSSTIVTGGSKSDLSSGDEVRVIAQGSTARVIQIKSNEGGYGRGPVLTTPATVTSKGANSFTATVNGVNVTFQVTPATRFVGAGNFASLQAGDQLTVTGTDTGSNFAARIVVIH